MINQDRPTSSVSNQAKINIGETWATIMTTYATEIRTWADMASIISNLSKVSSSITNQAKP